MTTEHEPVESPAAASKAQATERDKGEPAAAPSKSWRALGAQLSAMAKVLDAPLVFCIAGFHGDMSPEGGQAHTTEHESVESPAATSKASWSAIRAAFRLRDQPLVVYLDANISSEGRQAHAEREWSESAGEDEAGLASSSAEIDGILERLDQGIAAEQVAMDRLLERIISRTPR